MRDFYSFTSLFLLTSLNAVLHCEPLDQNYLQRGGKSIHWIWNNANTNSPDYIQRRRRYLLDENSEAWWKDMKTLWDPTGGGQTTANPLSPAEDIYFSGTGGHISPFANLESFPTPPNQTVGASMMVGNPQPEDIDSSLIRELIIEEHHKPSKIELASQRLRVASENKTEADETVEGEPAPESSAEKPVSFIEYVVPGVEHVEPHVEYVNDMDRFRESEVTYHQPRVEYVVPTVEFIEPEIEFFTTTRTSNVSERIKSFSSEESIEEEFGRFGTRGAPLEVTLDQNRFLAVHNEEKMTSETTKHKRVHRRNPDWGIPDVDYPTLEILPVVHFPCEEYTSGYYADVTARCQMFHICDENGQRSSFLCPIGTVFNQEYLVCDWWYNVNCEDSMSRLMGKDSYEAFGTSNERRIVPTTDDTESISFDKPQGSPSKNLFHLFPTKDELGARDRIYLKKKPNRKRSNLSHKAINYPIGYAILLREFMKNSPHYSASHSREVDESKPYESSSEDHSKNEKSSVERDSGFENSGMDLEKQRKKQEFYGGSKPFAVSSEKRIHESVRTKRIKIKYFPPKSPTAGNKTSPESVNDPSNNRQEQRQLYNSRYIPITRESSEENISSEKAKMAEIKKNKTWFFVKELGSVPDERNYYELKNDFEVIHFPQSGSFPKNKTGKKYDDRSYSSSASVINLKEELFDSADDFSSKENRTKDKGIESDGSLERRLSVPRLYKKKKILQDRAQAKSQKIANTNSYTTYTESKSLKKSYRVDPKFSLMELSKKFGERLYTKLPPFKVEKVTAYHQTPIRGEKTVKTLIFPAITRQIFDSEIMATTQIAPVYIHAEIVPSSNNTSKNQSKSDTVETMVVPKSAGTDKVQHKTASIITSKSSNTSQLYKSQQKKTDATVILRDFTGNKPNESDTHFGKTTGANYIPKGSHSDVLVKLDGNVRPKKNVSFIIPKINPHKSIRRRNFSQLKEKDVHNIRKRNETEKNLTDFVITSKFVNRISNLVSEIKAPLENPSQNHSLAVQPKENVSYTVSVQVDPKQILNSNKSSKNLQNSTDSLRAMQPWLIKSSSSSKLYNYERITKNTTIQNRWSEILNKNTTKKINNAHGGFIVVKKVRFKRNIQVNAALKYDQYPFSKDFTREKRKNNFIKNVHER
ncbi:chitin-binding type-2 domain-containing protein [Trichonephila inaurata madagascariensis]|uniref:Chitin-binding type-2 domain-containing protein n=1 Tax=Trichonephila inaurata madagascariensis TaxID=2747483 RepID=A0A8X6YB75_9ARAC|nr:chitin-binding type-2 domain-containing protein [Trichonephila inaurata madagascariensis]